MGGEGIPDFLLGSDIPKYRIGTVDLRQENDALGDCVGITPLNSVTDMVLDT